MAGEDTYKDAQNVPPTRSKLMQWAAACSEDCDIKRLQVIWEPESSQITMDLLEKLKSQN